MISITITHSAFLQLPLIECHIHPKIVYLQRKTKFLQFCKINVNFEIVDSNRITKFRQFLNCHVHPTIYYSNRVTKSMLFED